MIWGLWSGGALAAMLVPGPLLAQQAADPPPAQPAPDPAIIPDAEFDARLPPISDDLDTPLPSIAEWEAQQQQMEQAASDRTPPPVDPAIHEPLEPLESFDVEPFDESRYTESTAATAQNIRYSYQILGLDTPPDASAPTPQPHVGTAPMDRAAALRNVRRRFVGLSALDDGDGRAENGRLLTAHMRADQQLLHDILSSEGFFDANIVMSLAPPDPADGTLAVTLTVTAGPQYALGTIRFDAPPIIPENLIRRNFAPAPGDAIIADRILAAEANIAVQLPQNGYPFVELGQRDILLDSETGTGDYSLPVTPGARSQFGDIVTGANPVFDPAHLGVIARFHKGELYDSRKVDDLRQALVATGLYSAVAVTPVPTGIGAADGAQADGTQFANLLVEGQAGPPRTIAANAGYATGQGLRLEGSWTHRNLFPPEGALIASALAGTREQGASAIFRRSNASRRDRTVEFSLSALHSDLDAYEAFTGRLAGRISRDSTPIWQKRWTYSYGFELLATNEQDFDPGRGALNRRTFYLAALPAEIGFDSTTSLLDPISGFRVGLRLSPEGSLGAQTQIYARTLLDATAYQSLGDNIVLAGRARLGSIWGSSRADIAPSRRYYAGGGGSVRGFGYQQLGPKDALGRPTGGRSIVEGAAEIRYRFGNYGAVAFVDAGQVSRGPTPGFDDIRVGVGVGGRFYTNFGPLRVDVATPLNRRPGESRLSFYISIGQAF